MTSTSVVKHGFRHPQPSKVGSNVRNNGTGGRGPTFGPVKYVKEVSHVKHMHADSTSALTGLI